MKQDRVAQATLETFRRQFPAAAELARWISLASHVDRPFLRAMRRLFVPLSDAAAEADLWFSPLVESWSARGFVLQPGVVKVLNRELLADRAGAEHAWGLTEKRHHRVPPIIALEERIRWLALAGGRSATKEIIAELRMATRTAIREEDRAAGIGRWAASAFERLPERVRRLKAAGELWIAATSRLKRNMVTPPRELQLPETAPWLLPKRTTAAEGVKFERISAGLRVVAGEADRYDTLPITLGSSVEVRWRDPSKARTVSILHTKPSHAFAKELSDRVAERGHRLELRLIEDHALSRVGPGDVVMVAIADREKDPRIERVLKAATAVGARTVAVFTQIDVLVWEVDIGQVFIVGQDQSMENVTAFLRRLRQPPAVHRRVIAANPGVFVPVPVRSQVISVTRQDGARWQLSPRLGRLEPDLWANVAWVDPLPNQRGSPRWLPHTAYRVGQLLAMESDVWLTAPSEQLQRLRETTLEIRGEKVKARVASVQWREGAAVLLAPVRRLGRPLDIVEPTTPQQGEVAFTMIAPQGTSMDLPELSFGEKLRTVDDVPVYATHSGFFPTLRLRGAPILSRQGVVGHVLDRTDGEFLIVSSTLVAKAIEAAREALRTGRQDEHPPPESRRRQARIQEIEELLVREGAAIVGALDRAFRERPREVDFHGEGTAKIVGVVGISGGSIRNIELESEDTATFQLILDLPVRWGLRLKMPAGLYRALAQGSLGKVTPRTLTSARVVGDEAEVTLTEMVRGRCALIVETVAGDPLRIAVLRVDRIEEFELLLVL